MATTSFARAAVTGSWALLILAALPHAQQPTFKSRVDLVTVDATVLDRDGRPVEGLSPDDFSLLVDGQPRRIASLQYVTYAAPPADAAVPAAAPAASVQHLDGRVLLMAVDQANIRRVEGGAALKAAAAFIDTLSPADRIAAVPVETGDAIEFTPDHDRVKRQLSGLLGRAVPMPTEFPLGIAEAIGVADGSRGWLDRVVTRVCGQPLARVQRMERMAAEEGIRDPCPTHVEQQARAMAHSARNQGEQSVAAVKRLLRRLDDIEGAKTLVIVSEGLIAEPRLVDMTEVSVLAQQARATIYVLQVDVPITEAGDDMLHPNSPDDVRIKGDGLARLAGAAAGTILQLVGSDPQPFRRILRETSGHYLLAFEPAAADRDGATHRIAVNVKRAGASVRARPLFSVPPPPSAPMTVEDQLVQLLRSRRVSTALPVHVGVTAARAADPQRIETHVTIELEAAAIDATYGAVIVDAKGVVVTSATSRTTTGQFSFPATVLPGRYLFRVAAVDAGGKAGAAEKTVDVQLQGADLRTSDLVLVAVDERGASTPVVERTSAASLDAAFEVYAARQWTPTAPLTFELVSGSGGTPVKLPADLRWADEAKHWVARGRFDLRELKPGRYILSASLPGAAQLRRQVVVVR
jgi:VWFA-related protein